MKKSSRIQKIVTPLVKSSFSNGRIIERQVIRSIKILKSLPSHQAIEALSEYLKQVKRVERQSILYIETITSLSTTQLQKIKKIVERQVKITKIITSVNPQILGGFKLRIGDEIWDETLSGKITLVKEVLSGRSNQSN